MNNTCCLTWQHLQWNLAPDLFSCLLYLTAVIIRIACLFQDWDWPLKAWAINKKKDKKEWHVSTSPHCAEMKRKYPEAERCHFVLVMLFGAKGNTIANWETWSAVIRNVSIFPVLINMIWTTLNGSNHLWKKNKKHQMLCKIMRMRQWEK